MNRSRSRRCVLPRGFTLVESIIVLVLLGIASVAIMSMQHNIFGGQASGRNLQVGVQLMQECAEQILAVRQQSGYSAVTTNTCSTLGNYAGYGAPSVTVTADNLSAACPTGGTCEKVVISLSKTGVNLTPVTLELVNY